MATTKKKTGVSDKKTVKKKKSIRKVTVASSAKVSSAKTVKADRKRKVAVKKKVSVAKSKASVKVSSVRKSAKSRKASPEKQSIKPVKSKKVEIKTKRSKKMSARKASVKTVKSRKAKAPEAISTVETSKVVKRASIDSLFGTPTKNSPSKSGITLTPSQIKPEWVKHYKHLIELRSKLRNQMTAHVEDSTQQIASVGMHMADTGADNFDRDFALSLLSVDQDSLFEIESALKRIQRGVYGVCELTGKPIPEARLEAIPWTRYTVEAQSQLEKEGAFEKKRRLGTLNTLDTAMDDGSRGGESDEEDSEDKLARDKE